MNKYIILLDSLKNKVSQVEVVAQEVIFNDEKYVSFHNCNEDGTIENVAAFYDVQGWYVKKSECENSSDVSENEISSLIDRMAEILRDSKQL